MKSKVSFNSSLSKFGIGLFETIKVTDKPIDLKLHIDRLLKSTKELKLEFKYDKKYIEQEIINYIHNNSISNKALRITIFDEGYNISVRDINYDEKMYSEGFKLNISPIKRGNSIIYKHKTTNYYENIYTKEYAIENGCNDGLFVDLNKNILECSMSNIFFIKDNIIITPSCKLPILDGVIKKRIIKACSELNIIIKEDIIKLEDISKFDFAFVSNSLMGVMKVTQIEDIKYNNKNKIFDFISKHINTN